MDDLWRLDATELARLIRLGRFSSREATRSCLSRLRAVNPAIMMRSDERLYLEHAHHRIARTPGCLSVR